jgi:hypothetical protein
MPDNVDGYPGQGPVATEPLAPFCTSLLAPLTVLAGSVLRSLHRSAINAALLPVRAGCRPPMSWSTTTGSLAQWKAASEMTDAAP